MRVRRIGSVLSVLVAMTLSFTACAAVSPTATPAPTSTPTPGPMQTPGVVPVSPTATPAPTSTPTPGPTQTPGVVPTLADWVVDAIGIGTAAQGVFTDGLPGLDPVVSEYRLENGKNLHIDWKFSISAIQTVLAYRIQGEAAVVAKPDSAPVVDSRIDAGGVAVLFGTEVTMPAFQTSLGTTTSDKTVEAMLGAVDPKEGYERTLVYPGLTVALQQAKDAADKSVWKVTELTVDSSSFSTPRGLRTGLTVKEVVTLFSTGEYLLEEQGSAKEVVSIRLTRTAQGSMLVKFQNGVATSFTIGTYVYD